MPVTLAALSGEQRRPPLEPIWVRSDSNVGGIATLLVSSIKEERRISLRAIGAGAVNQAMKGIIKARQQLAGNGEDLVIAPGFTTVTDEHGEDITAMLLHCLFRD